MLGPGEFFEIPKARIARTCSLRPGQSLLHQFTSHVRSVWKENFCRHPALLVSRERSNHNVPVPDVSGRHTFRLLPIGLFEIWTIDIFEVNRFSSPGVTDRKTVTLMDSDYFCGKVSPPGKRRTGRHQTKHKTSHDATL